MSKNISELSGRQGLKNNLFDRYRGVTTDSPKPDASILKKLADEFLIGTANTYGAISFYDFLKPDNQGKKIYVCNGTVCSCAGTQDQLREELLKNFKEEEIGSMCCLGRCHENYAFQYNGKNYSGKQNGSLDKIIMRDEGTRDDYHVTAIGMPVLTKGTISKKNIGHSLKDLIAQDQSGLLQHIKASNLRGRGGAGFPIAIKLVTAQAEISDTKFIICNADEGDPGAFSDRYLLEQKPFDVLFGMMIAAYIIGAEWGVLYIRGEYPESVNAVQKAISFLRNEKLIGHQDAVFHFDFKVIKAQGSYICGEETALINSIEGQRPEVRVRPPFPAQQGLFNKPTVVNNVETLAALSFIWKEGVETWLKIGTAKSQGTKLLSLDSGFMRPGIYEVEMGMSLYELIYQHAGGFKKEPKALHIGGPLGGIVPIQLICQLSVDFESFSSNGFLLGHASVVSIPIDFPLIRYLQELFQFAADESCGKCFPCRLGTKRAEELFHKAHLHNTKIDKSLLEDLLHTLEIGSLCAHGGGIPLPVRNILTHFKEELSIYFK